MRKPQIEEAYAEQTPVLYSRYKDWAKGYGGDKVTLVSSRHAHWLFNRNTEQYEAQKYAQSSVAAGRSTQTGYLVRHENGSIRVVTATQLRGTWADCQKIITDANQAAKDAAEREATRRADFDDLIGDIGAFGLHVSSWSVDMQNVIVSGPELLALLRELQKGSSRNL